ncbi:MAG: M48 family metallopeptidase, partial [Desulfobacterales bacterium]|nr:M48 family metallopeptidase [Desulfobacterales bacterium]
DPGNGEKARELMRQWFSAHAATLFTRRLKAHLPAFAKKGAPTPEVRFRRMKKRWGGCTGEGVITLNTELVKAPIHCIDYVIIHELCHLIHPRHDKKFYRLLRRKLPDWKVRKERLEKVVI